MSRQKGGGAYHGKLVLKESDQHYAYCRNRYDFAFIALQTDCTLKFNTIASKLMEAYKLNLIFSNDMISDLQPLEEVAEHYDTANLKIYNDLVKARQAWISRVGLNSMESELFVKMQNTLKTSQTNAFQ